MEAIQKNDLILTTSGEIMRFWAYETTKKFHPEIGDIVAVYEEVKR